MESLLQWKREGGSSRTSAGLNSSFSTKRNHTSLLSGLTRTACALSKRTPAHLTYRGWKKKTTNYNRSRLFQQTWTTSSPSFTSFAYRLAPSPPPFLEHPRVDPASLRQCCFKISGNINNLMILKVLTTPLTAPLLMKSQMFEIFPWFGPHSLNITAGQRIQSVKSI